MKATTFRLAASIALTLAALLGSGCCGPAPERQHTELEWQLRHRMPTWSAHEWNAWEAELAAALDNPEPDPPMFAGEDEAREDDDE